MLMVLFSILGIAFFCYAAFGPIGVIHCGDPTTIGLMIFAITISILATILSSQEFFASIIKYKKLCTLFESLERDLQNDWKKGTKEVKKDYDEFNNIFFHLYYHTMALSRIKREKIYHKYKVINWIYYGKLQTRS